MRLLVVVQRYGVEINGGAELHARHLAERLARLAEVRVLTTCAKDYVSWRNEYPAGPAEVGGLTVERFPVARERDLLDFARRTRAVFEQEHSVADELAWLASEGPECPALIDRLRALDGAYDYALFFSARYYQAFHGCRAVPDRAVLVPTAEREPTMALAVMGQVFRGVRAVMYNTPEERAMIASLSGTTAPGEVVGVGVDVDTRGDADRFRARHGLEGPYLLYVGRVDANKGCADLFEYFRRFARTVPQPPTLVLLGRAVMDVPADPRIRHLGFVSDQEKADALAGAAALVLPSPYESLSMAVLEAWAQGRPVLVNGRCEVLRGQCLRANGGLFYDSPDEFAVAARLLLEDAALASRLGRNGQEYCRQEYAWPVVEQKYQSMFAALDAEPPAGRPRMEPLPGWFTRRRRMIPPASARLAAAAPEPRADLDMHS